MKNIRKIMDNLYYIGCSDRKISLFESVYPTPNGMSYNSYLLLDDKTALIDGVDKTCDLQFYENLEGALNGRKLDYFIINHLEPDHSALIKEIIKKYKDVQIVTTQKSVNMINQFFDIEQDKLNITIVKEGDKLEIGKHKLSFMLAPMVHWPEVMVTYDETDKILFSADAFGTFGAINGNLFDSEVDFMLQIPEYSRYYTNIVGKYGLQVNSLLSKAKNLDIKMICPLHGLILKEHISEIINNYHLWATYTPKVKSALILYASVYGNTQNTAEIIANELSQKGIKNIKMYDVSTTDHSYIISDVFNYSHIILLSTTYNNGIFVNMENLIREIVSHNIQNRTFAIAENGSWAPVSGDLMKKELETIKNTRFIENKLTVKSSVKLNQLEEITNFVKAISEDIEHNSN